MGEVKINKELPEFLQGFIKRYPKVWKSYDALGKTIGSVKGLDKRTQKLVKLSLAIGAKSEGAVHSHVRRCKKAGINNEEIYHVALLAITTIGWSSAMATFTWIEDVLGGR